MNKREYKSRMEQAVPSAALIQETKCKMLQEKPVTRKRPAFPALASMAAVLALILAVYAFLPTQIHNAFTVRAYAMEQRADGTVASREIGLADPFAPFFAHHDGVYVYLGINLDVEGENIAGVEFYMTNGFFAKQYNLAYLEIGEDEEGNIFKSWRLPPSDTETQRMMIQRDAYGEDRVLMFGGTFESMGSRITLEEIQADNLLLFAAVPSAWYRMPDRTEIQVYVVFHDGERQTESLVINFGVGNGFGMGFDSE